MDKMTKPTAETDAGCPTMNEDFRRSEKSRMGKRALNPVATPARRRGGGEAVWNARSCSLQ